MIDYEKHFAGAAYNTVMDNFMFDGQSNEDNVPLEFLAIMKEAIDRYSSKHPDKSSFPLAAMDFPQMSSLPEFVPYLVADVNQSGGYTVYPIDDELTGVGYNIPPEFERLGEFFDPEPDLDENYPRLPIGALADSSLDLAQSSVKNAFDGMSSVENLDDLSFLQAQHRNADAGKGKFQWRGEEYSTSGLIGFDNEQT